MSKKNWVYGSAAFSGNGLHRYLLYREWDRLAPNAVFIGLNPSTADENTDDPTIRRCINFARREGCGSLTMLNLYSFRATNPRDLVDALGAGVAIEDDEHPKWWADNLAEASVTVAAWGASASSLRLPPSKALAGCTDDLRCLGTTKDGFPRHPLYVKGDTPLVPFRGETP